MINSCRLCDRELYKEPILSLKGMPCAAQYYPTKDEMPHDFGIDLNIYQCSACDLVQLNIPPVDYFREVITAASLSDKNRAARLEQFSHFVNRFEIRGKKAIEIGCAKGDLLDVMEEAGLEAYGIEASSDSFKLGSSLGRKMIHGYIGEMADLAGAPYDAFICLNFFEHLPNPREIINIISKNTTSEAVGFVTVPNLEYLLKSRCYYEFVADHLSYFTQKTLTFAFESSGFDVIECKNINNDNDIAITVKKRRPLKLSDQYAEVDELCSTLKELVSDYKSKNKRIAVWGAGHRTLALLALSKVNDITYIVDSAKFKQNKFSPVLHIPIVAPETLKENKVDLVIVMVPGLYPGEVLKTINSMGLSSEIAILKGNKIEFTAPYKAEI